MMKNLGQHRHTIAHWAMELLVVAVGILIAFSVQQWAEDRSSARKAAAAEVRIRNEARGNSGLLIERVMIRDCLRGRLRDLTKRLKDKKGGWKPLDSRLEYDPGFSDRIYRTPSRNWVSDSYSSALQNGDLAALPVEKQAQIASLYRQQRTASELNDTETDLAVSLDYLKNQPNLSDPERNALLSTVSRLEFINNLLLVIADQNLDYMRNLGYAQPREEEVKSVHTGWAKFASRTAQVYGQCVDKRLPLGFDPD